MGMYTEAVQKEAQAEASNTSAVSNVIGNTAQIIAGGVAFGVGSSMTKGAIASGSTQKAILGGGIEKMGAQMIGRTVGGFSGIVIASNIESAYNQYNYGEDIKEMMDKQDDILSKTRFDAKTEQLKQRDTERAIAKTPAEYLRKFVTEDLVYSEKEKEKGEINND